MAEPLNRSLARGLDMLTLLGESKHGLELHEIAKALDIPKSSAFNLLHTLLDMQFVEYQASSSRYKLSMKMFEIGAKAVRRTNIDTVIREQMQEIYLAMNETVHCGVQDGTDVVYIDRIESTRSIRMTARIGFRIPLYCTAMGRAILACLPDSQVRELLKEQEFKQLTPYTVPDLETLISSLQKVREAGYAIESQESNENVCCMGVAACDREGIPRYAISVSAPIFRMNEAAQKKCKEQLLRAKETIERYLSII